MKPIIYVVVNKSLQMSPGKVAAQVGHAIAGVVLISTQNRQSWRLAHQRWIIVLEAKDTTSLFNIREYLAERSVLTYSVIDEGVNEISPFSFTALGIEILDKDSEQASWLEKLKLYTTEAADYEAYREAYREGYAQGVVAARQTMAVDSSFAAGHKPSVFKRLFRG